MSIPAAPAVAYCGRGLADSLIIFIVIAIVPKINCLKKNAVK